MLQGFAQADLVVVPGQVVEVGEILQALFLLFPEGHQSDHAAHARRRTGRRMFNRAAVVQPLEFALLGAQTEFAVIIHGAGEMIGKRATTSPR